MDFPHPAIPPFNAICNLVHAESQAPKLAALRLQLLSSAASAAQIANLAHYYPFRVHEPATAVKMTYIVGATANGNVDVGIYTSQKQRLVNSGSTAQGTINTVQEIDITDTPLLPGLYFMAIQFSSGTGTAFRISHGDETTLCSMPLYQQAVGSFGLPDPMVPIMSTQGSADFIALAVHFHATI